MKISTAVSLAALCASMAAATPLDKRDYTTEVEMFTVTVTVTGIPPASTTTAAPAESDTWSSWGTWGDWHNTWSEPPAPTTTAAAPPADTPAPSPAPAPESSAPAPDAGSWSSSEAAPAASSASSAPAPVSTSVSSDYNQGILDSHNIHRSNASVPSLSWDDNMASIAAQIAASCVYAHNTAAGGGGYGQNIGAGADPSGVAAMITNEMYNDEIGFYPGYGIEPDMSNFESWGHYSQIVWKSTVGVGCATQYCPGGLANTGGNVSPYFTVCNYSPPGMFFHPTYLIGSAC